MSKLTVAPDPSSLGTALTATVRVKNQGQGGAGPLWVYFWKHRVTEPTDPTDPDEKWRVSGLAAGVESGDLTYSFTPAAGNYQAWAWADSLQEVTESDEGNNKRSEPYAVRTQRDDLPDLVVSELTVEPDPTHLGTELTTTVRVKNQGTADTGNGSWLLFWEHWATEPPDWHGYSYYWVLDPLASGAETEDLTYYFTPAAEGSYTAWAWADALQDVVESNEDNNKQSEPYRVQGAPDLVVSKLTVEPDPSNLGTELTATVRVKNQGTVAPPPNTPGFFLDFWKHRDSEPPNVDDSDNCWWVGCPPLPPGGEAGDFVYTFTPAAAGNYKAWAWADSCDNYYVESNEDNNKQSEPYTVRLNLQPDLWIRNAGDTSWLGNNIYNADGTSQTKAQTVEQDVAATYRFRIYNDGDATESFRLFGPAGGAGWTVSYYISGVGEKTSDFTGGGYLVSNLAPGAQVTGWVNVRPGSSVPSGGQQVVLITGKSVTDPTELDAVKAVTTKRNLRPDLWIRNDGDASWVGNNIYNADGSSQTKTQTVAQDVIATYDFRIYNDGNVTDSFRLTGPAAGSGWTVSYYISGVGEKTSDFLGAGYLVSDLAVGAYVQGWVNVMPGSSVPSGGQQVVLITGKSVTDPTELDAVKAVTTKRKLRPDLWIRNEGDASWVGNNIYNADGSSQTKTQAVAQDVVATYYFRIYNDGNVTDSFRLTGPAAGSGWTVSYYISGVGEKTSDFTGGGYLVSSLAVGAYVQGWVNVRPGSGAGPGDTQTVLITGKSLTSPSKLDAVKTVTMKASGSPLLSSLTAVSTHGGARRSSSACRRPPWWRRGF